MQLKAKNINFKYNEDRYILKDIDFDELYRRADSAMYKSKNNTGYCATLECVTKTF